METKEAIIGALLTVFTILVFPPVWERLMSAAPDWAWRIMFFACVLLGVALVLMFDPISTRLTAPRHNPILSTAIIGSATTIVGVAAWLIFVISQPEARLEFFTLTSTADHPPGTKTAGISWRTPYSELSVWMMNPTAQDYEQINLLLTPDQLVAGIGQVTNVPNVNFELKGRPWFRMEEYNPSDGARRVIPLVLLANGHGYRVCCPRLPAKGRIEIVMATVTGLGKSDEPIKNAHSPSYRAKIGVDGKAYWYGYATAPDTIYDPKSPPTTLAINGTYGISEQAFCNVV